MPSLTDKRSNEPNQPPEKTSILRVLAAAGLLAIAVLLLVVVLGSSKANGAANRDFICYWASGRQFVHRQNPYDFAGVMALEQSAGWPYQQPMMMWGTPLSLPITMLVGLFDAKRGLIAWAFLILGSIIVSVRLLWRLHGKPDNQLHLLAYCFAPTVACMLAAQAAAFVFLGLVLFLYFEKTKPFFAGLALTVCLMKPHLFIPFAVVLVALVVWQRASRLAAGFGTGIAATTALTVLFDPGVWGQYTYMMNAVKLETKFVPSFSVLLRFAIDRNAAWLQVAPAAIACVWALWYFRRNRDRWDWQRHGSCLIVTSIMVAPYSWFPDEIVVFPALLSGLYRASDQGRSKLPFAIPAIAALIAVLFGVPLPSGFYVWTSCAWFISYLLLARPRARSAQLGSATYHPEPILRADSARE